MGMKLENGNALAVKNTTPGAGAYNPDYKVGIEAKPHYSIKGRYQAAKKLNVPGPGTYQKSLVDKKSSPNYGFGTSSQREPIQ